MHLELDGKFAVVTGASSSIGRETTRVFAAEGGQVIVKAWCCELLERLR